MARQQSRHRRACPSGGGNHPVPERWMRMSGDVLARQLCQRARSYAKEGARLVERGHGADDERPIPKDQHLLPAEHRVQVLELLTVLAQTRIAPEVSPAGRDSGVLAVAGLDEVVTRV